MKLNRRKILLGVFAVVGAVAGYVYYATVGCNNGTCAIWSNPFIATGYGALIGALVTSLFIPSKKEETNPEHQDAQRESNV